MLSYLRSGLALMALVGSALATPLPHHPTGEAHAELSTRSTPQPFSLNNWGGLQSLNKFDDFFGAGNFDGSLNKQILLAQQNQLLCQAKPDQRRPAAAGDHPGVLQEKHRLFSSSSSLPDSTSSETTSSASTAACPGFDQVIADQLLQLLLEGGGLNRNGFDFNGIDIGSHVISVGGSNWNNGKALQALLQAQAAAQSALDITNILKFSA
ncbi:hypothetical protein DFP72DRAFT_1068514 [Ephemerocybe angulata]|uniref:Uncharacterized protein n=1 Tax=Ephemerocybe angulata TaxID=980116 RepID=A0A8H6HXT8_9AGAR|nr:hypothetical protein DFP72DRAFT_1068514 [Tulosesus angulatus]